MPADLPPVPFAPIRASIEASFEQPLEALWSEFDPVPIGAASIAQVHRATTTDGRQVAVKVLRPGVRERFARDIDTYEWASAHLESFGVEAAGVLTLGVIITSGEFISGFQFF